MNATIPSFLFLTQPADQAIAPNLAVDMLGVYVPAVDGTKLMDAGGQTGRARACVAIATAYYLWDGMNLLIEQDVEDTLPLGDFKVRHRIGVMKEIDNRLDRLTHYTTLELHIHPPRRCSPLPTRDPEGRSRLQDLFQNRQ